MLKKLYNSWTSSWTSECSPSLWWTKIRESFFVTAFPKCDSSKKWFAIIQNIAITKHCTICSTNKTSLVLMLVRSMIDEGCHDITAATKYSAVQIEAMKSVPVWTLFSAISKCIQTISPLFNRSLCTKRNGTLRVLRFTFIVGLLFRCQLWAYCATLYEL